MGCACGCGCTGVRGKGWDWDRDTLGVWGDGVEGVMRSLGFAMDVLDS